MMNAGKIDQLENDALRWKHVREAIVNGCSDAEVGHIARTRFAVGAVLVPQPEAGDMSTSDGLGRRLDEAEAKGWAKAVERELSTSDGLGGEVTVSDRILVSDSQALDTLARMAREERSAADIAQCLYDLLTRTGR